MRTCEREHAIALRGRPGRAPAGCRTLAAAVALLALAGVAGANEPAAGFPKIASPLKRVGSVELDAATRTVVLTGWVNQVEGVIELLACGPNGKTHETIFVCDLNPLDLQTALLLLKHQSGEAMKERGGKEAPQGTKMSIWAEWSADGKPVRTNVVDLVYNRSDNQPLATDWTFTGSRVEDGRFAAANEESWVATYWDPWAVVNITSELGNDDEAIFIRKGSVPAQHTPVKLYLQAKD